MAETRTSRRIHIGNISPQLAENASALSTRLLRFGEVSHPLTFHTKPVNDFYFTFADMKSTDKEFEKLKVAFHGVTYMGRKLTLALAKPAFSQAWSNDHNRPETTKRSLDKHEGIAQARARRIKESETLYPLHSTSGVPITKTSIIGANNSALGYHISLHTANNLSGNTKNDAPSQSLVGTKSYGSTLVPKGPQSQQYSHTSGYGEVVKGRLRKTRRPAAHFARKEQSLRILVNGELKSYKFHKTKLWGVEKNKTARDLTYEFEDGTWKSGDGHAVERVEIKKPVIVDSILVVTHTADSSKREQVETLGSSQAEKTVTQDGEQQKNKGILAKLFNSFDFEKKVDLEEVLDEENVTYDSKGRKTIERFDFETKGTALGNESDEDIPSDSAIALVESYKNTHERPSEFTYYSEDDEGNDMNLDNLGQQYTTESIKAQYDDEHQEPANGDVEQEEDSGTSKEYQTAEEQNSLESLESSESSESSEDENEVSEDIEEKELREENSEEENSEEEINEEVSSEEESSEEESNEEERGGGNDKRDDSEEEESEEEDLMPTFGAAPATNTTEELRALFKKDPKEEAGLSIELEQADIDEDQQIVDEDERKKLQKQFELRKKEFQQLVQIAQLKQKDYGLFWTHFDSPFLQQQTQLSRLGQVDEKIVLPGETAEEMTEAVEGEEDSYEKWFWSMRGQVNRECKTKRKDLLRKQRKRQKI